MIESWEIPERKGLRPWNPCILLSSLVISKLSFPVFNRASLPPDGLSSMPQGEVKSEGGHSRLTGMETIDTGVAGFGAEKVKSPPWKQPAVLS